MAMNITNINTSPIELNLSLFTEPNMVVNVAQNADIVTEGFLSIFILLIFYVFIVYELTNDRGIFNYDVIKSSVIASGFVFIIGATMLVAGLLFAFYSVVWFGLIFLISLIISFNQKEKGLV